MGNCCASGTRDGAFDQKEHNLTSPELKKQDEPAVEFVAKPGAAAPAPELQENPDDIVFRDTLKSIKSHNTKTNVQPKFVKTVRK